MDALKTARAKAPTLEISALLQRHFDLMQAASPAESCHVMDPASVFGSADVVLTASRGGAVLGIGALMQIGVGHGELKSMHTAKAARGQGVGAAILVGLLDHGQDMGLRRISLETGSMAAFAPARALYAAHGFVPCPPFVDYREDPLSVFMTKLL